MHFAAQPDSPRGDFAKLVDVVERPLPQQDCGASKAESSSEEAESKIASTEDNETLENYLATSARYLADVWNEHEQRRCRFFDSLHCSWTVCATQARSSGTRSRQVFETGICNPATHHALDPVSNHHHRLPTLLTATYLLRLRWPLPHDLDHISDELQDLEHQQCKEHSERYGDGGVYGATLSMRSATELILSERDMNSQSVRCTGC